MTADELAAAVCREAALELERATEAIRHCLRQLSEEQVWQRPEPTMNSIGNLLLHLSGNVRQYFVSGIGGVKDVRDRPKEFTEKGPIAKAELLSRLETTIGEAAAALSEVDAQSLTAPRRIQNADITPLGAIFRSLPHYRGHVQEIIHMTRRLVGEGYRFAGMPPEPSRPE